MPAPQICRICLCTNGKFFKYDRYELKKYYEQDIGLKIDEKDNLPRYFCYVCAALLHKFHKFKDKCHNGQNILKDLVHMGPLSLRSVRALTRHNDTLGSSLNIINVNHRVKTYIVKSKEKPLLYKTDESFEIDEEVASAGEDNDNYGDNFQEDDDVPLLPEIVDVDTKIEDYDDVKIDIVEEKIVIEEEKIDIVKENINNEEEKIDYDEKLKVEKEKKERIINVDHDDEEIFSHHQGNAIDDDVVFLNDFKAPPKKKPVEKKPELLVEKRKKATKKKKVKDENKNVKAKRFEINNGKKKTELDPKNWLKFNLTEEEAIEEFQARGKHKRFTSAEFQCYDCLKGFSKEDMLSRHVKLRHAESIGPIECRFCHMRFKWKCFLSKHMRQHYTKFKCLRCDLVCPLETTAIFHEEYHNGVIRKCKHCGEEFKHLTTYYTHLRTHRSEHVCTLCGASFVSTIGLRIHKKIKHLNAEAVASEGAQTDEVYCKRCDIRFETKEAYEEHLGHSAMHVDGIEDLELKGPLASKPRKRGPNMKRVRKIPTDCYLCGKHFATQAACRKHHMAEHPRASFYPPAERHICEICGMSLAPGSVSSHLNTHTREKLYACSTCGRQFNSKGGLNTHQLTHTSFKPVACTLCDKRFKQSSSMRLHYRTFHLKEPYPKRNRKKKIDEITKLDEFPHEESEDNMTLDRWR